MKKIYFFTFLILCLVPLAGTFAHTGAAAKETRTARPLLMTKEGLNLDFTDELDTWYGKSFGFREYLIEAENSLYEAVFKQCLSADVIIGREGYLFYGETLNDYRGRSLMTEAEIEETADFLKKIQDYCDGLGVKFLFTVAPNKNSLYPQYMPPYYREDRTGSNASRLEAALAERGVNYLNLFEVFDGEEVLYHKLDSHWNNKGAALAYMNIMKALGLEYEDYSEITCSEEYNFEGDLYGMVHPLGREKDKNIIYSKNFTYEYTSAAKDDNSNNSITTENPNKTGGIIMYRDSFGNSL
ncbi:MAG: hypothetical protein LUD81_10810, partial [Clostridiales bacterium]|nr:hypothetical protein [Clostridiales bacterium]